MLSEHLQLIVVSEDFFAEIMKPTHEGVLRGTVGPTKDFESQIEDLEVRKKHDIFSF